MDRYEDSLNRMKASLESIRHYLPKVLTGDPNHVEEALALFEMVSALEDAVEQLRGKRQGAVNNSWIAQALQKFKEVT